MKRGNRRGQTILTGLWFQSSCTQAGALPFRKRWRHSNERTLHWGVVVDKCQLPYIMKTGHVTSLGGRRETARYCGYTPGTPTTFTYTTLICISPTSCGHVDQNIPFSLFQNHYAFRTLLVLLGAVL